MASFSPTQHQAVLDKINSGMRTISNEKIPELTSATDSLLGTWYVPGPVKDAVKWLVDEIINTAKSVLHTVEELLEGAAMPVIFFEYAWKWEDIKGAASDAASGITPQRVAVQDWTGSAATAYTNAVQPQSTAAGQIGTIAGNTATSLLACAAAGLAFYVSVGIIVFQLVAALVSAIALVGSIVFSWAGLTMVAADSGVSAGLIIAAVSTLSALLGVEASQMVSLHGQAEDSTAFPGGRWPLAARNG